MDNPGAHVVLPARVPGLDDVHVASAAAGGNHTMLMTDKGELFSAGANTYGQLGLGHRRHVHSATKVEIVQGASTQPTVVQASCGRQHTAIVVGTATAA